jgi:hypothetical protein
MFNPLARGCVSVAVLSYRIAAGFGFLSCFIAIVLSLEKACQPFATKFHFHAQAGLFGFFFALRTNATTQFTQPNWLGLVAR